MEEEKQVVEEKPTEEVKSNEKIADKLVKTMKKLNFKNNMTKYLILLIAIVILVVVIISITKKGARIEIKVKSTLEKIVEKNDLETVSIVYNVIAKKCNDGIECDKTSNNIDDFHYVVSCKGTIVAGIDFKNVKVDVNKKDKKLTIEMPEAEMKGEPSIESVKFLNGDEISASELPNARKLCQETIVERSNADDKLIPAAKEQARFLLEEYYREWIKAYDESYVVEVK